MEETDRDKLLIETRMDVAVIRERIQILADHEVRLRNLERFRWSFPGMAVIAVCVGAAGLVLQFL